MSTSSVRMWVIAKTDDKGVRTYYNNSRSELGEEWHVDLKFADLVEYDAAVVRRELANRHITTIGKNDVEILPVTLTVEED